MLCQTITPADGADGPAPEIAAPTITLADAPDDWHHHLRDGAALKTTVPHCVAQFARAIVMPNLRPPVTTTDEAVAYRARILAHVPEGARDCAGGCATHGGSFRHRG